MTTAPASRDSSCAAQEMHALALAGSTPRLPEPPGRDQRPSRSGRARRAAGSARHTRPRRSFGSVGVRELTDRLVAVSTTQSSKRGSSTCAARGVVRHARRALLGDAISPPGLELPAGPRARRGRTRRSSTGPAQPRAQNAGSRRWGGGTLTLSVDRCAGRGPETTRVRRGRSGGWPTRGAGMTESVRLASTSVLHTRGQQRRTGIGIATVHEIVARRGRPGERLERAGAARGRVYIPLAGGQVPRARRASPARYGSGSRSAVASLEELEAGSDAAASQSRLKAGRPGRRKY